MRDENSQNVPQKYWIKNGEHLKVCNDYYEFIEVAPDGKKITLVKDNTPLICGSTQIGLKSFNFKRTTIDGKEIELNDFQGKYIFLNFWDP